MSDGMMPLYREIGGESSLVAKRKRRHVAPLQWSKDIPYGF